MPKMVDDVKFDVSSKIPLKWYDRVTNTTSVGRLLSFDSVINLGIDNLPVDY
jgi:hypothetical protein